MVVVGLDGLDFKIMQKFGCEEFEQTSFGKLDLEGIAQRTPSLWASMITGEHPDIHGIEDLLVFRGKKARRLDKYIRGFLNLFGRSGLHLRKCLYYYLFGSSITVPDRKFLQADTIFERVHDAVALDVPGYSEYPYIAGRSNVTKMTRKHPPVSVDRVVRDMEAEFMYRRNQFFDNIGGHTLVMQHFHYPDWFQHLFFNDEEKLAELYQ
jgi:hypothetical protein